MRQTCPHCNGKTKITHSIKKHPKLTTHYISCLSCNAHWVANTEFSHTITTPNPKTLPA